MQVYETKIEVRYSETDQMGVVYHANYLVWFELGRKSLLDAWDLDYVQMEKQGYVSPVINVELSFKSPARYGDEVVVKTWLEDYDGLRVTYGYEIWAEEKLCVTGNSVHVVVRTDNFRPVSVRRSLPEWHTIYEKIKGL